MVKMIELIKPAAGISEQRFHDHWRHPHGTFARLVRSVRTYRQNHHIAPPYPQIDSRGYLGVAEVTFDSLSSAQGVAEDPMFLDHVLPDEFKFIERDSILITFCSVQEVWSAVRSQHDYTPDLLWSEQERPLYIKLFQFITRDNASAWPIQDLGDLGQKFGALRCVRSISVEPDSKIGSVVEFVWPTISAFEAGISKNRAAFDSLCALQSPAFMMLTQSERVI